MSGAHAGLLTLERVQEMMDLSPMIRFMGVTVREIDCDTGRLVAEMPVRPELERIEGSGQLHGGALSAFADTVGDYALALLLGGAVPTIDLRIDYLRPATGDRVVGTGIVRRRGRTLGIVDVEIHDSNGRLVAIARGAYSAVQR